MLRRLLHQSSVNSSRHVAFFALPKTTTVIIIADYIIVAAIVMTFVARWPTG